MSYWFSLIVHTNKNWECETETFDFDLCGLNSIRVSSYDQRYNLSDKDLWQRTDVNQIMLILSSEGYDSSDVANAAAKKLCNSLVLAAGHGLPLDPGFVALLNGRNPWKIGRGEFVPSRGIYTGGGSSSTLPWFSNKITKYLEHSNCTIEQIRACANICNATLSTGIRTSLDDGYSLFMARVTALETLSPDIEKNGNIRQFLDEAIASLPSKKYLNDEDRLELKKTLGNAKKESISAKCRTFIREHPNTASMSNGATEAEQHNLSAEERFKRIYQLRCAFTHGSTGPEEGIDTLQKHDTARQCGMDAEEMVRLYLTG